MNRQETLFRSIVEELSNSITYVSALDERSTLLYISPQVQATLGYTQEEFASDPDKWFKCIHPDDFEQVMAEVKRCHKTGRPFFSEYRLIRKDEHVIWVRHDAHIIRDERGRKKFLLGILTDISEKKQAEIKLREYEKNMEAQVRSLEEMNTALNVLLKKWDSDKKGFQEQVSLHIRQLIEPNIAMLKQSGLNERQRSLVSVIEEGMKEIVMPFGNVFSHYNLTPRELEVANLIKQGRTNKEISEILLSSEKAVAFHRQNIRRKLGLLHSKVTLKSYLISNNLTK